MPSAARPTPPDFRLAALPNDFVDGVCFCFTFVSLPAGLRRERTLHGIITGIDWCCFSERVFQTAHGEHGDGDTAADGVSGSSWVILGFCLSSSLYNIPLPLSHFPCHLLMDLLFSFSVGEEG